jgi:hypothetical protein
MPAPPRRCDDALATMSTRHVIGGLFDHLSASVSIDGDTAIPSVALDLVEFEFGRLLDLGTSGGGKPLIS